MARRYLFLPQLPRFSSLVISCTLFNSSELMLLARLMLDSLLLLVNVAIVSQTRRCVLNENDPFR